MDTFCRACAWKLEKYALFEEMREYHALAKTINQRDLKIKVV
jgi:hypothetical protein